MQIKIYVGIWKYLSFVLDSVSDDSFYSITPYGVFVGNFNYTATNENVLGYSYCIHRGKFFCHQHF